MNELRRLMSGLLTLAVTASVALHAGGCSTAPATVLAPASAARAAAGPAPRSTREAWRAQHLTMRRALDLQAQLLAPEPSSEPQAVALTDTGR